MERAATVAPGFGIFGCAFMEMLDGCVEGVPKRDALFVGDGRILFQRERANNANEAPRLRFNPDAL